MKLSIGNKLALVMTALSVVVILLLSSLFYFQFQSALEERVLFQLSSVKRLKISQIESDLNFYVDLISGFRDSGDSIIFSGEYFFTAAQINQDSLIAGYSLQPPQDIDKGEVIIQDLTTENPEGLITLAFYTLHKGKYLVALAQPDIQSVLLERTGLGETGESYLVGLDYIMRSASRFLEVLPTDIVVKSTGVRNALRNNPGTGLFKDYRGVLVYSAYEKVNINGLEWVILSEIDREEALLPLEKLKFNFIVIVVIILVFVFIAAYGISQQIVKPILFMERTLSEMSKGQIDHTIPEKKADDEIGKLFGALGRLIKAMQQTVAFAREIGSGNFDQDYLLLSDRDKLGQALLQMKDALKTLKEKEALLVIENQKAIINGEEKERSRLARELHDGLGPLLTTVRIKVQKSNVPDHFREEIFEAIDLTIKEVRRMSYNLMPSVLQDFGAGEAIENLVKQLNQKDLQIIYRYEPQENLTLPENINIVLYRITQEALANVMRHSGATVVKISLTEFLDHVSLFIADNGVGFDMGNYQSGNGLINMRERVKLERGIIEISSNSNGTVIEVEIPLG